MIKYALKCDANHAFESWFQSADAFDKLKAAGHLSCAVCGSGNVEKALMKPRVTTARKKAKAPEGEGQQPAPKMPTEMELAEMRKQVEENSTWVGGDFAKEARAMHDGEAPERAIWGEAKLDEAKSLIEDGIPVAPLPFGPKSKSN